MTLQHTHAPRVHKSTHPAHASQKTLRLIIQCLELYLQSSERQDFSPKDAIFQFDTKVQPLVLSALKQLQNAMRERQQHLQQEKDTTQRQAQAKELHTLAQEYIHIQQLFCQSKLQHLENKLHTLEFVDVHHLIYAELRVCRKHIEQLQLEHLDIPPSAPKEHHELCEQLKHRWNQLMDTYHDKHQDAFEASMSLTPHNLQQLYVAQERLRQMIEQFLQHRKELEGLDKRQASSAQVKFHFDQMAKLLVVYHIKQQPQTYTILSRWRWFEEAENSTELIQLLHSLQQTLHMANKCFTLSPDSSASRQLVNVINHLRQFPLYAREEQLQAWLATFNDPTPSSTFGAPEWLREEPNPPIDTPQYAHDAVGTYHEHHDIDHDTDPHHVNIFSAVPTPHPSLA
ncbi:MAG: hypothetical protein AAGJ35_02940 [Myxococcota bacterium]